MNEPSLERWAERLTVTARALPYPPTPNLAAGQGARLAERPARPAVGRWRWALAALALLLLALLAVPPVRAAVVEFIQIGVVRIFVGPATATPTAAATAARTGSPPAPTATPRPSPTPASSILDSLAGETTLARAQLGAGFMIMQPAYPPDLGPPDRIFLQTDGAPMVVLAWLDPARPGQARAALFEIAFGNVGLEKLAFIKGVPPELQNATVHGQPAAWTTGPYVLQIKNGDLTFERVIEGHVLIWLERGLTYRLELPLDATLDEAVKMAESLR